MVTVRQFTAIITKEIKLDKTVSPKITENDFQWTYNVKVSEATVRRCSAKWMFLKILKNS